MERRCGCGGLGLGLGGFDGFVTSHKVLICNIFWVCFVAAIVWVQANVGRSRGRRGGRGRDFGGCSRDYDATGRAAAGGGSGYVQEGRGDLIAGGRGLAERGGFEPPVDFKGLRRFSKPLLSTTQPPLREKRGWSFVRITRKGGGALVGSWGAGAGWGTGVRGRRGCAGHRVRFGGELRPRGFGALFGMGGLGLAGVGFAEGGSGEFFVVGGT